MCLPNTLHHTVGQRAPLPFKDGKRAACPTDEGMRNDLTPRIAAADQEPGVAGAGCFNGAAEGMRKGMSFNCPVISGDLGVLGWN